MATVDLALCGGGLQNALIVAALHAAQSAWRRVALVERGEVGGNHTWCFYRGDLSPAMQQRVAPFVTHSWSRYEVRFPGYTRILDTPYFMISSARLRSAVRELLAARGNAVFWERAAVARLNATTLHLTDGRQLRARMVIDARGARAHATECGYQKFYGQEIILREPHGLTWPIVMDATVAQHDGFRFMYVLPLGPRRALLEDTTFSDGPDLDAERSRRGIAAWLHHRGWRPERVSRTERGVLPMPLRAPPPVAAGAGVLHGGYGGGWFHPGTGYSLPLAAELAELVAATPPGALAAAAAEARRRLQQRARFCCLLNRLLFQGYPADARRAIFARFYRLPEPTIRRFFSLRLRWRDQLRILGGRPPRGLSLRNWRAWPRSVRRQTVVPTGPTEECDRARFANGSGPTLDGRRGAAQAAASAPPARPATRASAAGEQTRRPDGAARDGGWS